MAIKIQGSTIIDDSRNIVNSGIATLNYQGVAEVTIGSTSVGIGSTNSLTITPQVTQTAIGVGTVEILTLASNINNQDIFSVIDETGGITHLTVTNAGLIGIGTTNPAEKLHLEAGNLLISDGGNEVFYVSKTGPNALSIQNQSSNPAFDVTGIGSVGIGTTQPSSTFQVVNAGSELFSVSSALSDVVFEIDTDKFVVNSSGNTGIGTTNPTQKLDVVGNVKVTGDTYISGNTGIGTTNPTEKVDVVGNVKVSGLTTTQNLYVTGVSTVSDLYVNGALYDANNSRGNLNEVLVSVGAGLGVTWKSLTAGEVAGAVEVNSSSPSTPYYIIGVEDATGVTSSFYTDTDVVLTGDGRLGIGTTNPTEKVDVVGNVKVSGDTYISGNTGIGTTNPTYKLQVVGDFAATTKSFSIPHPTKQGMTLRYGSLESPYHGIRLTGSSVVENGKCIVELPDYIHKLVKEEDINIHITNIRHGKVLWVESVDISHNNFMVMTESTDGSYEFYWDFTAIRTDIEDMIVEY